MESPVRRGLVASALAAFVLPRTPCAAEWTVDAPAAHGFGAGSLDRLLAAGEAVPALRAILVSRNGALVAERYYGGATADQLRRTNSATKSVVSMLVGQALAQGRLGSIDQSVAQLLPEQARRATGAPAATLSLRQILSGTSGLAYDFNRDMRALIAAADPVQHVLALPRSGAAPGSWSYNDAAISLLGPILERVYALKLPEIARQGLFAPLGIDRFRWGQDRSGQSTAYMGLELRPRDFLALANMVALGGSGIVPSAWLAESLRPHTAGAWSLSPVANSSYGYLWFNGSLHGKAVGWAWGYGGQIGLVVPSQRLAIVTMAQEPPPQALSAQNHSIGALIGGIVEAAG